MRYCILLTTFHPLLPLLDLRREKVGENQLKFKEYLHTVTPWLIYNQNVATMALLLARIERGK